SVAAIGAISVVASLVLPRMQGAFEIGPGGIKGDLESEVYRGVVQKGLDSGLDAEEAVELAEAQTGPPGSTGPTRWRALRPYVTLGRTWHDDIAIADTWPRVRLADLLANEVVEESLRLGRETAEIVERVAGEKRGWQVRREVRLGPASGET